MEIVQKKKQKTKAKKTMKNGKIAVGLPFPGKVG